MANYFKLSMQEINQDFCAIYDGQKAIDQKQNNL